MRRLPFRCLLLSLPRVPTPQQPAPRSLCFPALPRMEDSKASLPIASSLAGAGSSVAPADDSILAADSSPHIGSLHGSYQNEGLLSAPSGIPGDGGNASGSDTEFGFQRPEFRQKPLAGTVQMYERHLFLCYKDPQVWPANVETAEFDRLPRLLSAAIKARKALIKKQTRLTLCEGEDGTESSNGDVLIFPDMIRYRRLTHFDVEAFVEEVLVKDAEWYSGAIEKLVGSFVFVCSHGSRDKRCGVCGPTLIKRFKEEIEERHLEGQVTVSGCSHIGGHKYAGNVIIFRPSVDGVTGHWYGYVSPEDVPLLLDQHIGKGEVVTHLWRGQMGLSEDEQKKALELNVRLDVKTEGKGREEASPSQPDGAGGCCQGAGDSTCCQNASAEEKPGCNLPEEHKAENSNRESNTTTTTTSSSKGPGTRKNCRLPTWFERWEREDTYAALAVAAAVASVAVAYSFYRQTR